MNRVRVIVTDKDMKERQVFRKCFPNTSYYLHFSHASRFQERANLRENGYLCGPTDAFPRIAAKASIFQQWNIIPQFTRDAPHTAVKYYNDNWHPIRMEWVKGFVCHAGNFMNFTNNRIESINSKLKSVISKFSSMEEFLEKLYIVIDAMRLERATIKQPNNF